MTFKEHNWRGDLVAALAKRQDANGSWVNRDDRFMEGDPNIVTSYGLLALHAARPRKRRTAALRPHARIDPVVSYIVGHAKNHWGEARPAGAGGLAFPAMSRSGLPTSTPHRAQD